MLGIERCRGQQASLAGLCWIDLIVCGSLFEAEHCADPAAATPLRNPRMSAANKVGSIFVSAVSVACPL
jgi:hypothetical protein